MMNWSITNTKGRRFKRNSSESKKIGLNSVSQKKVVIFRELKKSCFNRAKWRSHNGVREKQDNTCLKKEEKVIYNYETV